MLCSRILRFKMCVSFCYHTSWIPIENLHQSKTCCKTTLSLRILDYEGIPHCWRKSLTLKICAFFQRCWLPVISGIKQHKKTNNLEVLLLWPRWGNSYLTKGYTLLYAAEKASLSNPSPEQWGPALGKQGHLHAAVCRFQDHKGQSKEP